MQQPSCNILAPPSLRGRGTSSLVALVAGRLRIMSVHRNSWKATAMRPILLACLLVAAPAGAQEVRTAPEGHIPPPATVDELTWLAGIWIGDGIGGAPATEVYSPPGGGSVAGHFVQEDGQGGIAFFELLQIAEVDGSLVYRLKHFDGALAGWEERDENVSFPLVAAEKNALYFDG